MPVTPGPVRGMLASPTLRSRPGHFLGTTRCCLCCWSPRSCPDRRAGRWLHRTGQPGPPGQGSTGPCCALRCRLAVVLAARWGRVGSRPAVGGAAQAPLLLALLRRGMRGQASGGQDQAAWAAPLRGPASDAPLFVRRTKVSDATCPTTHVTCRRGSETHADLWRNITGAGSARRPQGTFVGSHNDVVRPACWPRPSYRAARWSPLHALCALPSHRLPPRQAPAPRQQLGIAPA